MKRLMALPVRTKVLLGLLAAVAAFALFSVGETLLLQRQLQAEAAKLEQEFVQPGNKVASVVTVSREMLVFGPATGKISVFQLAPAQDRLTEVMYEYAKEGGEWVEKESGICHGLSCQIAGLQAFRSAGVDVPESIAGQFE